ncbi:MAG: DUF3426 domain-containing protein [Candidatus Desulfacyla sp.]
MLIQCEKCHTIFNLEETRLKKGGSKVRCSRCGDIFMAYPSVHGEKDVVEDVPVPSTQAETETVDQLILIGDEEEPRGLAGKDKAFEADLESIYGDVRSEPVPDLEKMGPESVPYNEGIEPIGKTTSKKKPSKGGLRTVLLAILLVILGGAAAMTYWKPELIQPYLSFESFQPYLSFLKTPEKEKPADAGVRLLQLESVAGSFVDSHKSGQFFVIRGTVHSQYPKPRSHILIKGSILDNKGKVIESRDAYAGNTFTEEELKTLSVEEILKAMKNRDGMARQNFNVPSGSSIPFMIVFDNLPDTLSEFAVEAVSSSPGA